MKIVGNSFFRALCAMIAGGLLLYYPDYTRNGIVIAIGVIFLLSGLISCVSYFVTKREVKRVSQRIAENNDKFDEDTPDNLNRPFFPIVGIGSIILGFILSLSPSVFVRWLMYVLGAVIVVGAIGQYASLLSFRKYFRMPFGYWIMPSLLLLTGVYVLIFPLETADLPFIILGIALVVYGVIEIFNTVSIRRRYRRYMSSVSNDAEQIEEAAVEEISEER